MERFYAWSYCPTSKLVESNTKKWGLNIVKSYGFLFKKLHKTCDSKYDDVQTLLLAPKFYNREVNENDKIEYIKNSNIGKYFTGKIILCPAIYQTCNRLKENNLNYPKMSVNFKKVCLRSNKSLPVTKKKNFFLTLMKKIIYSITKNFFCGFAS